MKIKVKIPHNAKEVLVKPGQKVDFKTPLARTAKKKAHSIPIAQILGFDPHAIFHHLKPVIGGKINKGDIIAENKSLFTTKKYRSDVSGILREIKHDTGIISVEPETQDEVSINCFFTGEIADIFDGYLELTVQHVHETRLKNDTDYFGAAIFYPKPDNRFNDEELEGACIFAPEFDPLDMMKVETLGALGLITGQDLEVQGGIHHIVLDDDTSFEIIKKKGFPYMLIGHEPRTIIFYQ